MLVKPLCHFKPKHTGVEIDGTLKIGYFEMHVSDADVWMDGGGCFGLSFDIRHTRIFFLNAAEAVNWLSID